ncbi:MAG: hypothetical protein AB7I13_14250 [Vicinamibacterales bacterium]
MRRWFVGVTVPVTAVVLTAFWMGRDVATGQTQPPARAPQGAPRPARPARTADGKPNFSGVYKATTTANWDLLPHTLRPAVGQEGVNKDVPVLAAPVLALGSAGGVPPGPGVVEGNEIPYKPEALAKKKENAERWLDWDPEVRCYLPGIPRAMYMPYAYQITQGTNKIQMVFEYANASRTIHLDEVNGPPADTWMGHSVGRWEGDTLVVKVTNFNDRTWLSRAGDFHSDAMTVTERYTPITPDAIRYEATIEDPNVFTRPWKMSFVLYRQLEDNARIMEYRCVELVEETFLGHLRKQQLVKRWEGETIVVDITRKVPPPERLYDRR